ncbi:hypothetical protein ACFOYU_11745 [Microvirga sp. GCM10011540]|uniref:hypothetical protein n=1 Tax=Microvirga sp. GCM10011540 TaxID=3317338 RepID=UPI00361C9D5F
MPFVPALAILFIALKLMGYIAWSWLWVLSPIWIVAAIYLVALVLAVLRLRRIEREIHKRTGGR